ncbi:MAG: hypothetical protein Q9160_002560 [Pyrenula sp. 1 TL-2023]
MSLPNVLVPTSKIARDSASFVSRSPFKALPIYVKSALLGSSLCVRGAPNPFDHFRRHRIRQHLFSTTAVQRFSLPSNLASSLLSSLTSSNSGPVTIQASRTVPSTTKALYKTISSIDSYPAFLPFLTSATIDSRDPETKSPQRATLTIGYQGMTESFTSLLRCDQHAGTVEAYSGPEALLQYAQEETKKAEEKVPKRKLIDQKQDPTSELLARDGMIWRSVSEASPFKYLHTKWHLIELHNGTGTQADFALKVEFKNPVYNQILRATEGKVAEKILEGFLSQVEPSKNKQ